MKSISFWIKQRKEAKQSLCAISCVMIMITMTTIVPAFIEHLLYARHMLTTFHGLITYCYSEQASEGRTVIFI